jgi:hypothetical protein
MIAPLLALAMLAITDKGSTLNTDCKAYIAVGDATGRTESGAAWSAGRCLGYIDAMLDAGNSLGFCAQHATAGTVARVYLVYMEKNPKMLDEQESTGFLSAMQETYPCPAK